MTQFITNISTQSYCVTLLGVTYDHELLADIPASAYRDKQLTYVFLYVVDGGGYKHCRLCA